MNYTVELIKSVFPDTISAAVVIILLVLIFWMYKELRSSFLEESKSTEQRLEKTLEVYSAVELQIYKYFNDGADVSGVIEKISQATYMLPYEFLQKFNEFKESTDEAVKRDMLKEFHKEINEEILGLKSKQLNFVSLKRDKSIPHAIDRYIRTKLAPFGVPFIYTYINITFVMFLVLFTASLLSATSFKDQIWIFSTAFASIFYIMLLYMIIFEGFLKKRFKHSILNWILLLLYAPGLPLAVGFTEEWFGGIIALGLTFIYGYYTSKKCMKTM